MVQHFLKFSDISPGEIQPLIDRSIDLKSGTISNALAGASVVLLFEKPSLRTKLSFWIGTGKLGACRSILAPKK